MIFYILSLQLLLKNQIVDLTVVNTENATYVSFTGAMNDMGIPYLYDKNKKTYIFQKERTISIILENPFVKADDKYYQLYFSPIEIENGLYLESCEFIKVISLFFDLKFIREGDIIKEITVNNIKDFSIREGENETNITITFDPSLEVLYRGRDTLWSITFFEPVYDPSIFPEKGAGFVKRIEKKAGDGFLELKIITDEKRDVNIIKLSGELHIQIKNYKTRKITSIVVDPGHGGHDTGGKGNGLLEKDIVLDIAKRVAKELKNMGFSVTLTRTDDTFLSLKERTEIADNIKADLFISIHCNAVGNLKKAAMNGTEVYFLSVAKTDWTRAVEATENSSILFENGNIEEKGLKYILWDLAQTQFLEESQQLAIDIQESIIENCNTTNRGVQQANFYVLRTNYMPAILIETLFVTNPDDAKKLKDNKFVDKMAKSISLGIKKYADRVNGKR